MASISTGSTRSRTKFDQTLAGLRLREQMGIIPPRFVVEGVLKEMRDFIAQLPGANILATSFKTRVAKISNLSDQERTEFQQKAQGAIKDAVYPVYQKLIDSFQNLLP